MKNYLMILIAAFIMVSCAQSTATPAKFDLTSLEGKHFYSMQEGYSCLSNAIGSPKVLSWADHLEVQNGQLWQWGDLCDDEAAHLQPTAKQLQIQNGQLLFQGSKYQHFPEQPELCKESPWCVVSE